MMKKRFVMVLLVILAFIAVGCGTQQSENVKNEDAQGTRISYQKITPADAKERLESEKGIILLDVRTIEEYTEKHIPGSILIPVDVIEKEAPEKLTDKNATLFVYCRSGRRSAIAAEALVKQGYTQVFDLGGINDWPYETETGQPK